MARAIPEAGAPLHPRSVAHHLTPVFGYFRFALIDAYITADPTAMLRRPRVFIDEIRQLALDRDELRRLLAAARASSSTDLALIALMALLGLRVSEAIGARIEDLGTVVRGHRPCGSSGKAGSRRRSRSPRASRRSWRRRSATGLTDPS